MDERNLGQQPEAQSDEAVVESFFDDIRASGSLPDDTDLESAVSGVLCTLAMRLTFGEAEDFVAALPPAIRRYMRTCALHKNEPAQLFDRDEFIRKVAHHCRIDEDQAEGLARAVLHAVRQRIPEGEAHGVEGQLPKRLKEFWMNA